jgi:O-antigen/teichoic acid export membrane protein
MANAAKLAIQLVLNVVTLVFLGWGLRGMLISGVVGNAVVGSWLTFTMLREVRFRLSWTAARSVLSFSLPLVWMQAATFVSTYGDRFFLQRAFRRASDGDAAVGTYGLAYQFGFLLNNLAFFPFYNVWDPMRFEIAKRADRDYLYGRSFVYFNLLYISAAVGMSLFVWDFLRVMTTPAFHTAAAIAPIVIFAYVLHGWTDIQNLGLLITERTGLLSWANWISAAVALAGYAVLVPRYFGMGAAVATLIAFAVRYLVVLRMSQRCWPIQYEWPPVLKLLAAGIAVVGTAMLMPVMPIVASLATRTALFFAFLGLVALTGVVSPSERALGLRILRSPRTAAASLRAAILTSQT